MGHIESAYSTVLKGAFKMVNPIKKKVIKTECVVHKFINEQAVIILKNDGNIEASDLFSSYIKDINSGAVWADQDFKSSNHFYNPDNEKGLYGFSNAKKECIRYYSKALDSFEEKNINAAMFYAGSSCHLIQDMTVPQHVNINLLHHHRKYEQWIIKTYKTQESFKADRDGIYFDTIDEFINYNSKKAIETYVKYRNERNLTDMYRNVTKVILTIAQRSTAGFLLKFFNDSRNLKAAD